jgi:hypothetical protein
MSIMAVATVAHAAASKCGTQPTVPCISSWTCTKTGWEPASYAPAAMSCNDNTPCTTSDKCDGAGTCVGTADPPVTVCTHDAVGRLTAVSNTTSDLLNCGCLGHVCAGTPNGPPSCTQGACRITCNPGYTLKWGQCVLTSIPSTTVQLVEAGALYVDKRLDGSTGPWGALPQKAGLRMQAAIMGACAQVYDFQVNGVSRGFTTDLWSCDYVPETMIYVQLGGASPLLSTGGSSSAGYLSDVATGRYPIITGVQHGSGANEVVLTGFDLDAPADFHQVQVSYYTPNWSGSWDSHNAFLTSPVIVRSPGEISFQIADPVLDSIPYQIDVRWFYGTPQVFTLAHEWRTLRGLFFGEYDPPVRVPPPPSDPTVDPIWIPPLPPGNDCTNSVCY